MSERMQITSRANPTVVESAGLKNKKARDASGTFAFEGLKLYGEAIRRGVPLLRVFATRDAEKELAAYGEDPGCAYYTVSESVYEKLSSEKAPQGVFCVARTLDGIHRAGGDISGRAMMVCDIQDPGNLGSCVRSALAFGIDSLILAGECADLYNPRCIRGAMGAIFSQKTVRFDDPLDAVAACKAAGKKVIAAALRDGARPIGTFASGGDAVFAVGNEGHGLSQRFIDACDDCVIIPMSGGTESLNAAVAAGILMWTSYNS